MRLSPTGSLGGRLRTTLLAVALVHLLVVAGALVLLQQMREAQQRLTRDLFATIEDSHAGFLAVVEIEDTAGGFLTTGSSDDLARFRRALQPRPGAVTAELLQARLAGAPAARRALDDVRTATQAWVADTQERVQVVEAGGPSALAPGELARHRQEFREVRRLYDVYIDAVLAARTRAAQQLDTRTSLLFSAVLLVVATSLVAGAGLHAALRRWVTVPLAHLGAETRTVRSGALGHEVRAEGPPEVAQLGADVEAMRQALVQQLAELQRTQALLEQQAEELQRSNRDLEQFAYVASHDLQEPLRKVSSFCQLLERRYKGQLDERADQYIAFAVDGAKRMQLLINDLLAFSRVGRQGDGPVAVAMDAVLAEALANLGAAIEESGAVVTADPLPVVHGERQLLVQLLQNLIANALKFRGPEAPRIRVEVRRQEDSWEFAVRDNGIGVEPQYADRIFVIFQRLHPKDQYEGTGIGLALCKKIVEHHGGTIWLDRDAGTGATFRWTLPAQAPEKQAEEAEAAWTGRPR